MSKEQKKKSAEEDIRQVHYDAWKKTKKWIDIEVLELKDGSGWIGKAKPKEVGDPACIVYRDTKQQTIYAIVSKLNGKGFEVGNLPEIYGL